MQPENIQRLKTKIKLFLYFLIFVILVRVFVFQVYVVSGNSMLPTLRNGDIVFVSRIGFPISIGFFSWNYLIFQPKLDRLDIVIFEDQENNTNLKRVVGLPGEYYEIKNGKVFIDYQSLPETYLDPNQETSEPSNELVFKFQNSPFLEMQKSGRIPPNYYLLLGDNRRQSTDSRSMGLVPLHKLRGRVIGKL